MRFPKQKKPRSWRVLQDWIRHYADQEELPQSRVRRAVSFMLVALPLDRSLDGEGNPLFLVKGGVSMELRLKMRARTTKDLDTVYRGTFEHWVGSLDEALAEEIDDFSYSRDEPARIRGTNTFRVNIAIDYKGKRWGKVQLEVAPVEVEAVLDIDRVEPFDIGQLGLESPGQISVVGLPYLVAQKLHACTEVFDGQENERVHDLMDLLLARDLLEPASLGRVREACEAIFANRAKQPWPPELIVYPGWAETYAAIADEEGFPVDDVEDAASQVRAFIEEIGGG
ncbi:MAG TPA: nucleotidyl transferase AbiEii/AbiGii toxin family protein [Solirubrobacterales bacterium]|nr:nucleotidyl transferase AbiEii/AbiGii toxin family protein [Solirubrobacterales bacterium]